MSESKFREVTIRVYKYLAFDKQKISVATIPMIEYQKEDSSFEYVPMIEKSALDHQAKRYESKIAELDKALGMYANWANWRGLNTLYISAWPEDIDYVKMHGGSVNKIGGKTAREALRNLAEWRK